MGKIRWLTPQTRLTVYFRYKTFSSTPVARYNRRFCRVRTGHGKPGRSWNLRADVSKYRGEKGEKSKILKKIHKVALGKLLT